MGRKWGADEAEMGRKPKRTNRAIFFVLTCDVHAHEHFLFFVVCNVFK